MQPVGLDELEVVELSDLNDGDQIAVRGEVKNLSPCLRHITAHTDGTYLHHGIFLKETWSVIEFQGVNKKDAKPRKRPFLKFFEGNSDGKLYRVRYEEGKCFDVEETKRRANEALEKGNSWPGYNLLLNNCESFATFLKTGVAVSQQVLMALIKNLGLLGCALAASSIEYSRKSSLDSVFKTAKKVRKTFS